MIPDWDGAVCTTTDAEVFFPERGRGSNARAKAMCHTCPVQQLCLETAIANHEPDGIWGGMTYRERNRMIKNLPQLEPTPPKVWPGRGKQKAVARCGHGPEQLTKNGRGRHGVQEYYCRVCRRENRAAA